MADADSKDRVLLKREGAGKGKTSGARFIAETFKGYGVTHVFFMETILNRALVEMETLGIRRILTHSEKTAAYMADGYARASRRPGVCMAQSVGAANLASGLQEPFLGLSPVIAFSGKKPPMAQYRNAYQEISHGPLFEPVTKYHVSIDQVEQLPYLLRQAFREATSGAPGPAHLDILGHLGIPIENSEAEMEVVIEEVFARSPSIRPEPEMEKVREVARALQNAERPVIVAGGGAVASMAGAEIVALAETLSIPVATSLGGKGIISDHHPLSVGVVGSYSRWCANRVVSEADLVLYVGSHTGDQVTNEWTIPLPGTAVIQIDIDPLELGRSYPNSVPLMGDARVTVRKIKESIQNGKGNAPWVRRAQELVNEWRKEAEPLRNSSAVPIRPERLCKEITEVLPPNGILVVDTGNASIWTGTMVDMTHPGQGYLRAAGSLGWAFPASLGAKCGAPERPVVCFTGDGGFFYHLSELETAARCGIKTVTVVNNNHCLSQITGLIDRAYGDKSGNRDDLYRFGKIDFAQVARDMGCLGIRVEEPEEISKALKEALASDSPAVVDVVTDPKCRAAMAWKPTPVK
jgi:acetolactate synthase I/II/III large subunit